MLAATFLVLFAVQVASARDEALRVSQGSGRSAGDVSISAINVLLPVTYGAEKEEYLVTTTGGCFKWYATRPDMVSVREVYAQDTDCSNGAYLFAASDKVAEERNRGVVFTVYAEETTTGQSLRCEVFFAHINRVEILTTTRLMYKDEPEVFSVQAFDVEDNYFTSLDHIHFDWEVYGSGGGSSVLRIESENDNVDGIHFGGNKVLVRAIQTGKAHIAVKLSESGYTADLRSQALITVHTPLRLNPKLPLYITLASEVQYTLQTRSSNDEENTNNWSDIMMPNGRYKWVTDNSSCVDINAATGLVWGVNVGDTLIHVHDVDMPENRVTAVVHVAHPAYIELNIYPAASEWEADSRSDVLSNWYLVNRRSYDIHVNMFDKNDNQIAKTPNMIFETKVEEEHFAVTWSSATNDKHLARTVTTGVSTVEASLARIKNDRLGRTYTPPLPLTTHQKALISAPVTVTPSPLVLLPWHPSIAHTSILEPSGGSGDYRWAVRGGASEGSVISVGAHGKSGMVAVHGIGEAQVRVADGNNALNYDTTTVRVSTPKYMRIVAEVVEAEVGDTLVLLVALFDEDWGAFQNCSALPIRLTVQNPNVFRVENETAGHTAESCRDFHLLALKEGFTTVHARYEDIKTEITIAAFPGLTAPTDSTVLVTLGSSWSFVLDGGPVGWPEGSKRQIAVAVEDESRVRIERYHTSNRRLRLEFRAVCLNYGAQEIKVSVSNAVSETVPSPVTETASIHFICAKPDAIAVMDASGGVNDEDQVSCGDAEPFRRHVPAHSGAVRNRMQVRNGRALPIVATLLDSEGREFDNFTSVQMNWQSDDEQMAHFLESADAKHVQRLNRRLLRLANVEGSVHITIEAVSYIRDVLSAAGAASTSKSLGVALERLSAKLDFVLLPNVALNPSRLLVFNHEQNRLRLVASGGSRYLSFSSNDTGPAELVHDPTSPQVVIHPHQPGVVIVTAKDLCLDSSLPAASEVRIADAAKITLRLSDKLQLGSTTTLEVTVMDEFGEAFDVEQFSFMELVASVDNEIITLMADDYTRSTFQVTGTAIGTGAVVVSATLRSGEVIQSDARQIHVFPPIEVVPRQVELMCGGSQQVTVRGGPHSHVDLSFTSENPDIASVDEAGTVAARQIGETHLRVVASGLIFPNGFGSEGESVVFAEDSVPVKIDVLHGVHIVSPTSKVFVGSEVDLHVAGSRGESPFFFGSSKMRYEWSVADGHVALLPLYESAAEEWDFAVRAVAKSAGSATIVVRVTAFPSCAEEQVFEARYSLKVEDSLQLVEPSTCPCSSTLMLPFQSSACITTNEDNEQKLSFSMIGASKAAPAKLSSSGCLTTGSSAGTCHVLVEDRAHADSLVVTVVVRAVEYLTLRPLALDGSPAQYELAIGSSFNLKMELRDRGGRLFSLCQGGAAVATVLNHPGIVKVVHSGNSSSLRVHGLHQGDSIIKVFLTQSPEDATYIRVRVGQALRPASPVMHLGGYVNFEPSRSAASGGTFSSADSSVLSIDPVTGQAVGKAVGRTTVYFTSRSGETTYTTVNVVRIGRVEADVEGIPFVTNVPQGAEARNEYRVKLLFYGHDGSALLSTPQIAQNVQVNCAVKEKGWAYSSVLQDASTGETYCVITPMSPSVTDLAAAEATAALTVIADGSDGSKTYSVATNVSIPYLAAFVVKGAISNIVLSPTATSALVEIVGKSADREILATSSDRGLVTIVEQPTPSTAHTAIYEITASGDRHFDNVEVTFYDYVTGQKERIQVRFARPSEDTSSSIAFEARSSDATGWILLGVMILCIFAYYLCSGPPRSSGPVGVSPSPHHQPTYVSSPPPPMASPTFAYPSTPTTNPMSTPIFSPVGSSFMAPLNSGTPKVIPRNTLRARKFRSAAASPVG